MLGSIKAWVLGLSTAGKLGLVAATVVTTGVFANAVPGAPAAPSPQSLPPAQVAPAPTTEHKIVTETKEIPFTSSTVEDASITLGKTATTTAGANGTETMTYDVSYVNGVESGRKLSSDTVTTPTTNEIITKGTFVAPTPPPAPSCPNGSYTNVSGNEVCRPSSGAEQPVGATAQCRDGSWSYSQHARGTCSYHGGVANWL